MKPDAPEFTIARLIANAQAMVIKISHEMYLVYLRAGKSFGPRHYHSRYSRKKEHIKLNTGK